MLSLFGTPALSAKIVASPIYQRGATSKLVNYPLEKFGLFMQNPAVIGAQTGAAQRYESEEY